MIRRQSASDRVRSRPTRPAFVPDQLVVRVEEDALRGLPALRRGARGAAARSLRLPSQLEAPFDALRKERRIREVRAVFSTVTRGRALRGARSAVAAAFATSVHDSESEALRGINLLHLSKSADLESVRATLEATYGIDYVHRVPARWPSGGAGGRRSRAATNDPMANRQWGLRAIRWFQARPLPNATGIKVGVLDTGVDAGHPDLSVASYTHDGVSAKDIVGHGTHVAGIIDAVANNRVGISGVCDAELHAWKIFGDDSYRGDYYVDEVLYQRALNAARSQGIQVVNLSIGGTEVSRTEGILIRRLVEGGCVVVADTPHVTAAAALLLARHARWTPRQVARRLGSSAARVPAMRTTRKSRAYGHGLLDLAAALE